MSRKTNNSRNGKGEVERTKKRAAQNIRKQKQAMSSYFSDDVNFGSFANNLALIGLKLRDIPGDGNCLFRALGDQLDGNSENHLHHREETVKYMIFHKSDFEPFVEDDVPFSHHVDNLRNPGTYAGNDAIVAFARTHDLNVVIHQMNAPMWTVKGSDRTNCRQLHIAYHNGDHYSSIRKLTDNGSGPANIKLSTEIKDYEKSAQRRSSRKRTDSFSEYERRKVRKISEATGCQDYSLIRSILNDNGQDEDQTIGIILQSTVSDEEEKLVSSSCYQEQDTNINQKTAKSHLWTEHGTGNRVFGNTQCSSNTRKNLNTTKRLTNRQRKDQARRDKKNKPSNAQRRKNTPTSDSDESEIIVKNLSTLNI